MKLIFGAVPFVFFALLLASGIVKATNGSPWLLLVGVVLFVGLMLRCCLPVKH